MEYNYFLSYFICICVYFLAKSVAREAIVGGTFARLHNFQYQATVFLHDQPPKCGGGVIKNLFILTAAHCLFEYDGEVISRDIYVLLGTIDLNIQGTTRRVEKIFVPKEFDPSEAIPLSDIAVLKLREPLDFERHHLSLDLPNHEGLSYTHTVAKIAGFGWDMLFDDMMFGQNKEHRLRFADVKVRSHIQCAFDHQHRNFEDKYFCARIMQLNRNAHRGTCTGDAGGPLVLDEKIIIGILSTTTYDCREGNSSSIYTNVGHYRQFILDALHNNVTNMHVIHL